jgi:hypothetical protein
LDSKPPTVRSHLSNYLIRDLIEQSRFEGRNIPLLRASQWAQEKSEQFANDPANFISVEACLNRQKGAKGPEVWLPPKNQCEYVLRYPEDSQKVPTSGVSIPVSGT